VSLKIQTSEYLISDSRGLGIADTWRPRKLTEAFLESTKDGPIKLSPDPVTMIDGDLTWFNNSRDRQRVAIVVNRAPRSVIVQSPSTVVIHDAVSWMIGEEPEADYPSVAMDTFGGRMQIDRSSVDRNAIQFGRFFLDGEGSQTVIDIGLVQPMHSFHFRYIASVQTPGTWVTPGPDADVEPRWEAYARWTRLVALGSPMGSL
jgi:hypothetical protein